MDALARRLGLSAGVLIMAVLAFSLRDYPGEDRLPHGLRRASEPDLRFVPPSPSEPGPFLSPLPFPVTIERSASSEARIRGVVVDEQGNAVESAQLRFEREAGGEHKIETQDGAFELSGPGTYTLVAVDAPRHQPITPSAYRFVVREGVELSGARVLVRSRPAVKLAAVAAEARLAVFPASLDRRAGDASFVYAAAGDRVVATSRSGVQQFAMNADLAAAGEASFSSPSEGRHVEGRILRAADDMPVEGALIELNAAMRTHSDASGRFAFPIPIVGPAALWVSAPGLAREGRVLEHGERAATLRLSPGYTVAGNVTAQAEVLATFAAVRAHLGADARAPRAAQVSYGDASFRLEGLSSGTYDLLVAAPGRAPHAQVLRVDGDERANVTLNVGEHLEVQTPREGPHLDLVGWGADPTVPRIQWAERMPVEGDDDVHRHRFSDVVPGAALVRFAADTDVRTERLVAPGLHVLE